jgi:sugar O-acyltransferase (sialic acid O-acetyltransferase NeuD family)
MKKLLILGAGDFAHLVAWTAENAGYELAGFVVNDEYLERRRYLGYTVWPVSDVATWGNLSNLAIVSGIVSPQRMRLVAALFKLCDSQAIVHRTAWVHQGTVVHGGAFVNAGATLDLAAVVENHAIVNRNASIGHHVYIGPCATLGPNATLCGNVNVGRQAMVGAGAVVREGVTIGEAATVGMGAAVLADIPPGEVWWGVPARKAR